MTPISAFYLMNVKLANNDELSKLKSEKHEPGQKSRVRRGMVAALRRVVSIVACTMSVSSRP